MDHKNNNLGKSEINQIKFTREEIAFNYFKAFYEGRLDEVYSFFHPDAVVEFAMERSVPFRMFIDNSTHLIATMDFKIHGVYTSRTTENVIMHFVFSPKGEPEKVTEGIDIFEFQGEKIIKIKVIPNSLKE